MDRGQRKLKANMARLECGREEQPLVFGASLDKELVTFY